MKTPRWTFGGSDERSVLDAPSTAWTDLRVVIWCQLTSTARSRTRALKRGSESRRSLIFPKPHYRRQGQTSLLCRTLETMSIRGFMSHLDLNVADPARSIAFYALVLGGLGYQRHDIGPDRASWSLTWPGGGVFAIEVRPPREAAPRDHHERYAPGIDHLAFHAASRSEVDRLYEVLRSAGHPVADPPAEYDYTPGYYATAFDDPDGIRLEVVYEPQANP